jgi:hypothetical protein
LTHRGGHGGRLLGHTVRWRKLVTRGHVRSA